jgi:hypothetical protein
MEQVTIPITVETAEHLILNAVESRPNQTFHHAHIKRHEDGVDVVISFEDIPQHDMSTRLLLTHLMVWDWIKKR